MKESCVPNSYEKRCISKIYIEIYNSLRDNSPHLPISLSPYLPISPSSHTCDR
ncbi:MAG: hypothetical protein F6J90_36795 [Moorea sp. SIOASIH]|uniref:hypothetical protein n=1 Tax=Moorena sp. SIOASIH TaxID=2607817 RepID=UPI0013BA6858|nr:hypothetical protein [Moorena sp. SIOASIH]NEO41590.1 hypothetical protein [Moorena sp. SIOASIH]